MPRHRSRSRDREHRSSRHRCGRSRSRSRSRSLPRKSDRDRDRDRPSRRSPGRGGSNSNAADERNSSGGSGSGFGGRNSFAPAPPSAKPLKAEPMDWRAEVSHSGGGSGSSGVGNPNAHKPLSDELRKEQKIATDTFEAAEVVRPVPISFAELNNETNDPTGSTHFLSKYISPE